MKHELFNVGLPKWPQMLVRGRSVHPEQALEIIRRTDTFFTHGSSGNNRAWNRWVKDTLGMPPDVMDATSFDLTPENWQAVCERQEAWAESWGVVNTNYVSNAWVSSSFIYGPHGWCQPDGTIAYVDNIGKWPSVEEVYNDWTVIAQAFPFLVLDAVLMSGEGCEEDIAPLVGFRVRGETVTILPGDTPDWFEGFPDHAPPRDLKDALAVIVGDRFANHEIGISQSVIERWAAGHRARNPHLYQTTTTTRKSQIEMLLTAASASRSIND